MKYFASQELIKYSKEQLKDLDVIMDLFDQSFTWASDKTSKVLGFSHEELAETRVLDLRVMDKSDEEDLEEHTAKKDYVDNFRFRTKDMKEILVKARVKYIEFNKEPYQIIKILEVD